MTRDDFEIDDCGPVKLVFIKPGRDDFRKCDLKIDGAQFPSTEAAERAIAKHIASRSMDHAFHRSALRAIATANKSQSPWAR